MVKIFNALLLLLSLTTFGQKVKSYTNDLNVMWDTPSENSLGSMPAGNGDIGINLWIEKNGDLLFYLSKTDAWNENARLFKLGRVRLSLSPNPFLEGNYFSQKLNLKDGVLHIEAGDKKYPVNIDIWVDANHPVVQTKVTSAIPVKGIVAIEIWRNQRREITNKREVYSFPPPDRPKMFVEPDTVIQSYPDQLVWAHRNQFSIWSDNLKLQALGDFIKENKDPLLNRTFGGSISSNEMVKKDSLTLVTPSALKEFTISVFALTGISETSSQWADSLQKTRDKTEAISFQKRAANHKKWWNSFWERSYISISSSDSADYNKIKSINQGYRLQRYINACGGRGNYPIKFNGSIFTVDTENLAGPLKGFDADYRQWDGAYWFQNTRLPYWSMLAAGDFDMMRPLFKMYMDNLSIRKLASKKYYGHEGAFFPETFYFWGTYMNENYGMDRSGKPDGLTDNRFIRRYWQGGLELTLLMREFYTQTKNAAFAKDTLVPFTSEILSFFDQHWARDAKGKIKMEPAQSLETWWTATNPLPEIAGIRKVAEEMLKLPDSFTTDLQRTNWRTMLRDLPDIPVSNSGNKRIIAPAEIASDKQNSENPELYAVFPYRIFAIGNPDLDLAINTFIERADKGTGGWVQNAIQAALLGLTEEAAKDVVLNFSSSNKNYRFPAMWGPNYDWTPDQDHGSVAMIALQKMVLQEKDNTIFLLPAWPAKWNVSFKLCTAENSFIEGRYSAKDGLKINHRPMKGNIRIINYQDGSIL